ncbi:hypothetical protein AAP_02348 [Ascosphaera apis ARSEF 7405]|uniref:Uncharacterized protein n=1 Tax=Ascosphaera apis ARSEF 7405 TaxID=392613 RepID=A0A168A784_9EURO|nr:hypothetical protein AAP_02348 [Ascosphaera apis ARSEF 7405]
MADETVVQRRSSAASTLPVHRRPSATTESNYLRPSISATKNNDDNVNSSNSSHNMPLLSSRGYSARRADDTNGPSGRSWPTAIGRINTGSETLAAKLPRSQTEFITSTSPTSATSQDRFKYPTRSHTTGHQNLARSPSNLHSAAGSLKPTTTSTPASFGATHSSHESISTIDPLSQVC